uniref:hypothetical protein n=1 Tax=Lachnoclostridium phocaeense TaxID=1871021 RepID=UPI0026DBB17B|nr:hypothetical protein [Lachnoclostridium phocaeense]
MRIKINGEELRLPIGEVRACKRIMSKFFMDMKRWTDKHRRPTYYFTLLVVTHVMTQKLLDEFDPKALANVMNSFASLTQTNNETE